MQQFLKWGGIASLVEAILFLAGFVVFFALLGPAGYGDPGVATARHVAFLEQHHQLLYVWYTAIYILFGIVLVVLVLALYAYLSRGAAFVMQLAVAFGLLWCGLVLASGMVATVGNAGVVASAGVQPEQAESLWRTVDMLVNALGGGNEITGSLWVILVSWAGHKTLRLPHMLNGLGIVAGVSGLCTMVPAFEVMGAAFGLGLLVWFGGLGVFLLQEAASVNMER